MYSVLLTNSVSWGWPGGIELLIQYLSFHVQLQNTRLLSKQDMETWGFPSSLLMESSPIGL